MAECAIPECSKSAVARGMCESHYRKYLREIRTLCGADGCARWGLLRLRAMCLDHYREWKAQQVCAVDGCASPEFLRGWCSLHYSAWRKFGDPLGKAVPYPGYGMAHQRVRDRRGKATEYPCVDCGGQAQQWSYRGGAADERIDAPSGCAYSGDPDSYDPRCRKCHMLFDGIIERLHANLRESRRA